MPLESAPNWHVEDGLNAPAKVWTQLAWQKQASSLLSFAVENRKRRALLLRGETTNFLSKPMEPLFDIATRRTCALLAE